MGLPRVAAAAAVQSAILHSRSGDRGTAWRTLAGVDPSTLPPPDRMRMLMNRGTIASELRRFDDAAADLAAAASLAGELGEAPVAFMARHNLGWIRFLRGDLPTALREMHDADALDVDPGPLGRPPGPRTGPAGGGAGGRGPRPPAPGPAGLLRGAAGGPNWTWTSPAARC